MSRAVPEHLRTWLHRALPRIEADERLVGVAVGGSWLRGELDEWSDLDLVVAVTPDRLDPVMDERLELVGGWGPLLNAFTGEHVGEPRVIIALYEDPLVHVDMKFLAPEDLRERVEDPEVLWERGDSLSAVIASSEASWPPPDGQWVEDRFWIWVHYVASKIGRGELFEALAGLDFLRGSVLVPLRMVRDGHPPQGSRRVEQRLPDWAERLAGTLGERDRLACARALERAVELYAELRDAEVPRTRTEQTAKAYLAGLVARLESGG